MTTPNNNIPALIIADAMFDAGLLEEGQSPNSEQLTANMRKLQDLINYLQTQGLKLWLNTDLSITLVDGTGTYKLGPIADGGTVNMTKPLRVLEAYYLDANDNRRPLVPLSWNDYIKLSQVTQTGAINSYFVNKQQLTLDVFFWLIPDATAATGTGHVLIQQQVTTFISLTETMNFPIEWRMALRWGLANDICTGQPQAIMDRCAAMSTFYIDALEDWDVEDAPTQFQPDARGQYQTAGFR